MGARPVARLDLDPPLQALLLSRNLLTARDVLHLSPLDLMELVGLTESQANDLLVRVSAQVTPAFVTAQDLLHQALQDRASCLFTGLPALDGALRRGLPAGALTELVGPSGIGKSQFCHMAALLTALPPEAGGLGGAVIYIDTERKFSAPRLVEMCGARAPELAAGAADGGRARTALLSRVVIAYPANTAELKATLMQLEALVVRHSARLVVVDSIAALARAEFGGTGTGAHSHNKDSDDGGGGGGGAGPHHHHHHAGGGGGSIMERQELLGVVASALKHVAEAQRLPVLVTNQVTTRIGPAAGQHGAPPGRGGAPQQPQPQQGFLTAALGAKWAHCVNVRLVLERAGDRRFLKVAKSPSCGHAALEYAIGPSGLVQVQAEGPGGEPLPLPQALRGNVLEMAIANGIDYGIG